VDGLRKRITRADPFELRTAMEGQDVGHERDYEWGSR
jgi:hypothetical protein